MSHESLLLKAWPCVRGSRVGYIGGVTMNTELMGPDSEHMIPIIRHIMPGYPIGHEAPWINQHMDLTISLDIGYWRQWPRY